MRVLMLGWEFPPHAVGGLGSHTYGLVSALVKLGVKVDLVLPFKDYTKVKGVDFSFVYVDIHTKTYAHKSPEKGDAALYADVLNDVETYTDSAVRLGLSKSFDIIHANDWLTAHAGIELKRRTGKPLVLTMHSTEYDRTIGHPWDNIILEEKHAVENADVVVAVSRRLKEQLVKFYGADPKKIHVVYNAVDRSKFHPGPDKRREKVVLYAGRLSIQKGVDHLIRAFRIVADQEKRAVLYIVGEGTELKTLVELSIDLGLSDRIFFFGHVPDDEMEYLYSIASVFVMPSVSEPFGITALEAVASRTPTIVSVQSGVSEVLKNVFKVDFWDAQVMADVILGILRYPGIGDIMAEEAYRELRNVRWEDSAQKFRDVYKKLIYERHV